MSAGWLGVVVLYIVGITSISASWYDQNGLMWYEQKPTQCPYEDPDSHVCSTLASGNFTCWVRGCCDKIRSDDETQEYDGDYEYHGEHVYYLGDTSKDCRICYSVKACTLYKCFHRCCDGYSRRHNHFGRCVADASEEPRCENGGTRYERHWYPHCYCPSGFTGERCEIPECDCVNNADCMVKDGRPYCNCTTGFTGDKCQTAICTPECQNGGECVSSGTWQYCVCPAGFVGDYCERRFEQHEACGSYSQLNDTQGEFCYSDRECEPDELCCKDGVSTRCRRTHCSTGDGRQIPLGQSYHPANNPCQECTCLASGRPQCWHYSCLAVNCSHPVTRPGECCPVCEEHTLPQLMCPRTIVTVKTNPGKSYAELSLDNTGVKTDMPKTVVFSPREMLHCRCRFGRERSLKVDVTNQGVTCSFKAIIKDEEPPTMTLCPNDVYIYEDELPRWDNPEYHDNVGVWRAGFQWQPRRLKQDNYTNMFTVNDYDGNMASCRFTVTVVSRDTEMANLPQGLKDRAVDVERRLITVLLPVTLFLLILVATLILVCVYCHRARRSDATVRSSPVSISGKPGGKRAGNKPGTKAFNNDIYAVSLPDYSELPANPPVYSETGSMKDYVPDAPPSYTNPEYESIRSGTRDASLRLCINGPKTVGTAQ